MTTPQQRSAETKRIRTRQQLIASGDEVVRLDGWDVSIEAICKDAHLSPATFYTVFPTRGDLFRTVFTELVVEKMSTTGINRLLLASRYKSWASQFWELTSNRRSLTTGMLIDHLERPVTDGPIALLAQQILELRYGKGSLHEFVDGKGVKKASSKMQSQATMAALVICHSVARDEDIDIAGISAILSRFFPS